jgi:hypothetical protein
VPSLPLLPPVQFGPVPAALEALLVSIAADVIRLTDVPRLREAAGNLLNDCRDIAREGRVETAMGLARHLGRSIPDYFASPSNQTKWRDHGDAV